MAWSASRRRIASSRSWLVWCRWSALVAANRMRSMRRAMRLTAADWRPARKQREHAGQCRLRSATAAGPAVERAQRVDEHDLPVEAGEVIAEEGLHDVRLVGLEAARQHGGERAALERWRRSAAAAARRSAAASLRDRPAAGSGRAGRRRAAASGARARLQIGGEELRRRSAPSARRPAPCGSRLGEKRRARRAPRPRVPATCASASACADHSAIVEIQQRQVEQPLAGIVDDVDMQPPGAERRARASGAAVLDGDAQLADAARAFGPVAAGRR